MNNLEKQHLIKCENLNHTAYLQSLIQEAVRTRLLTGFELENIQEQFLKLLARQTDRYTGGDSSSVRIETAEGILQSIFYCIGIALKSCPHPDISIEILKQKSLSELFEDGKKLIKSQIARAKLLLCTVRSNRIATDNIAYNDTLSHGIADFFSAYNVEFAAHETPASIDYPLCVDKTELIGIEYICNYLQTLFLENQLCKKFPKSELRHLLICYDNHYQDLLINIFELVITNLMGSALLDKGPIRLNIEPSGCLYLKKKLASLYHEEINNLLRDAARRVCTEFDISDRLLQEYILSVLPELSVSILDALQNNRLECVFISFKQQTKPQVIHFKDHAKMEDEKFRSITSEIRTCRFVSDKITMIQRNIRSLADLIEIFEADCIFEDEYYRVLNALGDTELALLVKRLPPYSKDYTLYFTECEIIWQVQLVRFLEQIDMSRKTRIHELAEKINID